MQLSVRQHGARAPIEATKTPASHRLCRTGRVWHLAICTAFLCASACHAKATGTTGDASISTRDGATPTGDGATPTGDGATPTGDGATPTGDGATPTGDGGDSTRFLDPSRAIDWSSAGFSIPSYTANCSIQPSLAPGSGAASANAASIQKALASCDATHNVVNLPVGTYYVAGFNFGSQGHEVLRGAGPKSTYLYSTSSVGCGGGGAGICMISNPETYANASSVLPPAGALQCVWTAGYAQGTTSITLSHCGSAPPLHQTLILDQANDTTDTSGIYVCDDVTSTCSQEPGPGDIEGRSINGVTHAEQQIVHTTGVTKNADGTYTVTFTPGLYFNNIRSSQSPGAWWPGFVENDGIENLTVDYSSSNVAPDNYGALTMYNCYDCWMTNVRSIDGPRDHVHVYQSAKDVIRNDYFYQSQSHYTVSYCIELDEVSGALVENNIIQQQTVPVIEQNSSGSVIAYNLGIDNLYTGSAEYLSGAYYNHNSANNMNLWEGNEFPAIWADDIHGSSVEGTLFRNLLPGWQSGKTQDTVPIILRDYDRAFNIVGNVLGQPGYAKHYQTYAASTSTISGGLESTSIYSLGLAGQDECADGGVVQCDPLVVSSLMRWGNYDTVDAAAEWNPTEASPAAVPYVNANFDSSYFSSLPHTLPSSLYYSSQPSWWPAGKPWPPIGPDVSGGNLGICSGGTFAGAEASSASECAGGTWVKAWAGHANMVPAQNCYLNVMHGPPNGTGSVLSFDASQCYPSP